MSYTWPVLKFDSFIYSKSLGRLTRWLKIYIESWEVVYGFSLFPCKTFVKVCWLVAMFVLLEIVQAFNWLGKKRHECEFKCSSVSFKCNVCWRKLLADSLVSTSDDFIYILYSTDVDLPGRDMGKGGFFEITQHGFSLTIFQDFHQIFKA